VLIKDVFELRDHLRCELLLLQIVSALHDATDQPEVLFPCQTSVVACFCYLVADFLVADRSKETLRSYLVLGLLCRFRLLDESEAAAAVSLLVECLVVFLANTVLAALVLV